MSETFGNYEQAVVEFLSRPENLPVALEVADHIEQVKDRLQTEFWLAYEDRLEKLLAESRHVTEWQVAPPHTLRSPPARPCTASYYATGYSPLGSIESANQYLRFLFQQSEEGSRQRLYFGIHWKRPQSRELDLPALRLLASDLTREGFQPTPQWYVGYKNTDYFVRSNAFLIRLASNRGSLLDEVVGLLWALFVAYRERVEAINRELAALDV